MIFSNDNNIYYYFLNKEIKDNKEIKKLVSFEKEENIDSIKIKDNYFFIFYNNTKINIYKINNELQINLVIIIIKI